MKKLVGLMALLAFFGMMSSENRSAFGAESGTGHYIPGAMADFGDMAPSSGLALLNWYLHYNGSIGRSRELIFGGNIASNISATINAEMFGAMYTTPWKIFEGKYYAGLIIPYVWETVTGTITHTRTRTLTLTRTDDDNSIGDLILIPFGLGWTSGEFKWGAQLNIYAPTGDYSADRLANVGLNYWTFEPMASFSYISQKIGLEISTTAGFSFNTTNNANDYQSGDVFHIDATIAEHLPLKEYGIIGVGVNGYYWKQFTGDSGSGARLGSFETMITGVGPVVSYISPKFCGGHTVVAELKWLPQMGTKYTLSGDYVWFKAAVAF